MHRLLFVSLSILMLAAFGFAVACDEDEPSEEEARAAFCGDLEQLDVAVSTLLELSAQSTVGEVRAARDGVSDAVDDVKSSGSDVSEADTTDLEQAYDDLNDTVQNIQDDQTVQEVLDSVSASAQNVAAAGQQLFADIACDGATPTTEAQSTEPVTVEPTAAQTVPVGTAVPTESVDATETAAPSETAVPTDSEATEPVPTTSGE